MSWLLVFSKLRKIYVEWRFRFMLIRLLEVFVNLISFFFRIDSFVFMERHFSNGAPGVEKMLRQVVASSGISK